MMKCPSLSMIRRRCPRRPGMSLVCSQLNGMPNSADRLPVSRLKAAATDEKGQAFAGCPELRSPLLSHVNHALGALSP
jgi:hypothetical protein